MGVLNCESVKTSGEQHFITSHVSGISHGVIIDVGANIGNYSIRLRRSNPEVPIYSFEPHPVTYGKLHKNTEGLNVRTFNLGVGSAPGAMMLYDYADRDGSSHASMYKEVIEQTHHSGAVAHEVTVVALDDFAIEEKIDRVGLLKIDTEGHELEVLKGFRRFIKANRVDMIQFEFNEMNMASRVFFKDFWDLLPNYDFYRMLPGGLLPLRRYNPVLCEIYAYQNIVAKLKKDNPGQPGTAA
jgi:FkbM family methyltransferase